MKGFSSLCVCLLLLISSFTTYSTAAFTSSVTLEDEQQTYYSTALDGVLDPFVARHTEANLWHKFPIIRGRIASALQKTGYPDELIYILEYLDRYIVEWMEENPEDDEDDNTTSSSSSSNTTSSSSPNDIDTSDYKEGEKQLMAGMFSGPIFKFEVTVDLEEIDVTEYSIIADSTMFGDVIEKVYIYNESGDLLDSDRPNGKVASFNTVFTLDEGDNDIYVALQAKNIDDIDEEFSLEFTIDEAEGVTSENDIDPMSIENTQDSVHVVNVSAGDIQLLDSYYGYYVDSKLYNQASADLAIISIDIAEGNDDVVMKHLEFTLEDNTVAGDVHTTLKVQRIDSLSDEISLDAINGKQVHFDLSDLGSKATVKDGTTAVFIVSGTPLLDSTAAEAIEIELNPSVTDNGIFSYAIEGSSSNIGTKSTSYIGKIEITD